MSCICTRQQVYQPSEPPQLAGHFSSSAAYWARRGGGRRGKRKEKRRAWEARCSLPCETAVAAPERAAETLWAHERRASTHTGTQAAGTTRPPQVQVQVQPSTPPPETHLREFMGGVSMASLAIYMATHTHTHAHPTNQPSIHPSIHPRSHTHTHTHSHTAPLSTSRYKQRQIADGSKSVSRAPLSPFHLVFPTSAEGGVVPFGGAAGRLGQGGGPLPRPGKKRHVVGFRAERRATRAGV